MIGESVSGTRRRRAWSSSVYVASETLESRRLLDALPTLVKDINPTVSTSGPEHFVASGDLLYFIADDGLHGKELWRSDGTAAGTFMLKDIRLGIESSSVINVTDVNGTVFFDAFNGTSRSLWKSDGTVNGTVPIVNVNSTGEFVNRNGALFFYQFTNSTSTFALWKSDGTPGGTSMVHPLGVTWIRNVAGTLFMYGSHMGVNGIYKSDGTATGTQLVFQTPAFGQGISQPTAVGSTLFFQLDDNGPTGRELWKSDGTTNGTVLVKDIYPGPAPNHSFPQELVDVDGTLFFRAQDGVHGEELWKSDGTANGTVMVKDIAFGNNLGDGPSEITGAGSGTVYFVQEQTFFDGRELLKTDGTAAGTMKVAEVNPSVYPPTGLTDVNGTLYFSANDGLAGYELWRSDGTEVGTFMVMDIHPSNSSSPQLLTNVNGNLFFTAFEPTHGRELWTVTAENPLPEWLVPGPGAQFVLSGNTLTISAGSVTFAADAASTHPGLTVVIENDAGVVFNVTQHLGNLTLTGTSTAVMLANGNRVLVVTDISLAPGSKLDLSDNNLLVDYSTTSPGMIVSELISTARAGGAWTGPGITSSAARNADPRNTTLGLMEASEFKSVYGPNATFTGETIDATAVLVKYTYYGDTDFNGTVNFDDYVRTDSGFNNHRTGWLNGDFDGNGTVNFDDYVLIDLAFNTQGAALRRRPQARGLK